MPPPMRWRDTLAGVESAQLEKLIDPAVRHRGHFGYLDRWASERSARPLLARMVLFKGVYQLGLGTATIPRQGHADCAPARHPSHARQPFVVAH